MFGFHQDGAEAGNGALGVGWTWIFPGILWKKGYREFCQGEVKVAFGGLVEDALGKGGRGPGVSARTAQTTMSSCGGAIGSDEVRRPARRS